MNCFAQGSGWLACTLCLLIATLFISETSYSHSVPTPLDATSDDGTPVELVTHKDLYDDDGNFMAHIHAWSISSYTQEEVDEIHANNPHTSDAVIEGLPKVGDVKGVYGKSYRTPGFPPPDDANEIGKPDPDGISENYGSVSTPQSEDAEQSEETQAQANSIRFFASAQGDSQNQQPTTQGDSQNQQPAIQQQPTTQDDSQNQQQLAIQQQPTTQDDSQNQQQPAIQQQPTTQDDSQNQQQPAQDSSRGVLLMTSGPGDTAYGLVENSVSAARELEIMEVVEMAEPRRLVVRIRNNGQNFVDLTDGWSLTLVRLDGSSVSANMKSRNSLFITPYNAGIGTYRGTKIALLPQRSFGELDNQERLFLDFPYFYGQQSGYSENDVLILSYKDAEMSRYPEPVGSAPRLRTSLYITLWSSMKKAQ